MDLTSGVTTHRASSPPLIGHASLILSLAILHPDGMEQMEQISSPQNPVNHLTVLPAEILHHILQWLYPADLGTLPRVCRALHSFVKADGKLYRDIYLRNLDEPKDVNLDWARELHDLVRLQTICRRPDAADKKHELGFVHDTVTRLLKNASPSGEEQDWPTTYLPSHNAALVTQLFESDSTIEAFLQRSFLFERVRNEVHHPIRFDGVPKEVHQQSAKLHCLYGKPILNVGRLRSKRTYPYACSKVYDLRQYTTRTMWGPFMNDDTDRVDWEKVEAILIVLGHNINKTWSDTLGFRDVWDNPFCGSWSGSHDASSRGAAAILWRTVSAPLDAKDPYGVTGTWYRVVCFLDYNDFFSYNFDAGDLIGPDTPRPALDVGEALRLIIMTIRVTGIEAPGPDDGQDLPVVHFRGVSRAMEADLDDDLEITTRGSVRLTKEGEVRWTTFSIFHSQERWRSEGIQVGGVRSARGVVGNWFDSDYDMHGPAGPTAFWKAVGPKPAMSVLADDFPGEEVPFEFGELDSSDLDAEMGDTADEEDDDVDDIEGVEVANELPGLLHDAELDVRDVLHHVHMN
ncbi:hypothetical protein G7046_g1626 [Stylonectria norvegica]|nr:hypothetical protein G7046_g1626 [Stylonectria norvegica]